MSPTPSPDNRSSMMTTLLVMLAIAVSMYVATELREERQAAEALTAGVPTSPPRPRAESRLTPPRVVRPQTPTSSLAFVAEGAPQSAARPVSTPPPEEHRARPTTPSYDWYEGAEGMSRGIQEAQEENRAMAVYFYTDWCGYCRQLEREILERAKVEGHMKYLTKIRINPEESANARFISERYGVTGYPAFFVHPAAGKGPTKVSGMKRHNGEWRVKTPEEFIESLRRIVGD